MSYLMISNELLDGSFWNSIAPEEQMIVLRLMRMASFKKRIFRIHHCEIHLEKHEACISVNALAKQFGIGRKRFSNFLKTMVEHKIMTKSTIFATQKGTTKGTTKGPCEEMPVFNKRYTLLSFCEWVFGGVSKADQKTGDNREMETDKATTSATLYIDKEEEEFIKGRGQNFMEYRNPMIRFSDNPQLRELIPEESLAYFAQTYECRMDDLENLFRYFIARQQSEGMEFLMHKELQRRFAYFLREEYNRKKQHEKSAAGNPNYKNRLTTNNYGKSESEKPELQREKSEYEKRREADDAAIVARMPRFGGSGAGLDAVRKRKRRYGTKDAD